MPLFNPLSEDLDHVLVLTEDLWEQMRGKKLFLTGGTGFFGCWLLESLMRANEKLDLEASVVVLTRNAAAFEKKAAHLAANSSVSFLSGDVSSFDFPDGQFDFVIHAATDVYAQVSPLRAIDTIYEGTRRVLDFAVRCQAAKVLLTSSGAVYGKQPVELSHISENYQGAPNPSFPNSAYGEGKRMAELIAAIYAAENDIEIKIARCFAFVGPYLQLDGQFAVGNFIRNSLEGKTIYINGDGTPLRSYLYAADLAVWLWTILFRGKSDFPYNVGSENEISILDLARTVSKLSKHKLTVETAQKPDLNFLPPQRYVPNTQRAFNNLGLRTTIDLETAIRKTMKYHEYLKDYKFKPVK